LKDPINAELLAFFQQAEQTAAWVTDFSWRVDLGHTDEVHELFVDDGEFILMDGRPYNEGSSRHG
jgi:hypothetical protein